ncbi:chemotaxis protein CheC [Marinobacterium jannaschii]|uniref:chemotaxis protein CheC n=1 Tax=Marinobacterium jannaschii TaxID=64970 RepID=UPI0004803425|nr:chemotaxis protein CheC [Marinobacterium jannaschii]
MTLLARDNAEYRDALQEVLNISMGQAAASLAQLINTRVHLSIPKLHWVNRAEVGALAEQLSLSEGSLFTRQAFTGYLRGEVLVCFAAGARHQLLGECMGYGSGMTPLERQELTLELTNILSGACINGLAEQLEVDLHFSAPSMLSQNVSLPALLSQKSLGWSEALFMDIRFTVESISMSTDLLICMPDEDTEALFSLIGRLLEE